MNLLKQLTQAPASPKSTSKLIPKGYRWTPEKAANALKTDTYMRIGFDTITPKKLSGVTASWNAKVKYTSAVPFAKQVDLAGNPILDPNTGKPVRNPATGRGLDVVYLNSVTAPNGQEATLRVTGKWFHIKNLLMRLAINASLSEADAEQYAIYQLATRAYGVHTILEALPPGLVNDAYNPPNQNIQNAYKVMTDDLKKIVPNSNPQMTYAQLAHSLRPVLYNQFVAELGLLAQEKNMEKAGIPNFDVSIFIVLSGRVREAKFLDANGNEIAKGARGAYGTRKTIAEKLKKFLAENNGSKLFKITGYPVKPPGGAERPQKDSKRSKLVGVPFTFGNTDMSNIVYVKGGSDRNSAAQAVASVIAALTDLGIDSKVAKAAASVVETRINEQSRVQEKPQRRYFVGTPTVGVLGGSAAPLVAAPELTVQPLQQGEAPQLDLPSLSSQGTGVHTLPPLSGLPAPGTGSGAAQLPLPSLGEGAALPLPLPSPFTQ
jgi:hypothetical protein